MTIDSQVLDIIKAAATIVAAGAFAFAIVQYSSAQRWRRAEFVANEIKAMKADPGARAMMTMLDWDGRRADLFPHMDAVDERFKIVSHEALALSLRISHERSVFTEVEGRIRDAADDLLDHLERYAEFVDAGLVRAEAFRPYLEYWLDLTCGIADEPADQIPAWRYPLWGFVEAYGYRGVISLARKLGYKLCDPRVGAYVNYLAQQKAQADRERAQVDIEFKITKRTGKQVEGTLTWAAKNLTSGAISGPEGNGALPNGTYVAHRAKLLDKDDDRYRDPSGNCWMQVLDDAYGRTELGIHPDGGPPGTHGCIGLTVANTKPWYDAFYGVQGSVTVQVKDA